MRRFTIAGLVLFALGCTGNIIPGDRCDTKPCSGGLVCRDGACVQPCVTDTDCPSRAHACEDGACVRVLQPLCASAGECDHPGPCESSEGATCQRGACQYQLRPAGFPCDDANACTADDQCDEAGTCAGIEQPCVDPPPNECIDDSTFKTFQTPGACDPPTGACYYEHQLSVCVNCEIACLDPCREVTCEDLNGGCQFNGACEPGPPAACSYDTRADGAACDLTATSSWDGVCLAGECVGCIEDADCTAPAGPAACYQGTCDDTSCSYTSVAGGVCAPETCIDGELYAERICAGDGTCEPVSTASCNGYQCASVGVACRTTCASAADCVAGYFCPSSGQCTPKLADGDVCTGLGDVACVSGHCDGLLCCAGGDCCNQPGDCPANYSSPSVCTDASVATDCQGTREEPRCNNHICVARSADDDSGCDGLAHACPDQFAAVECTAEADQQFPACRVTCTDSSQCAHGYVCQAQTCVSPPGVGDACTGTGQGTCQVGLQCDHGVCCSALAATCCTDASDCTGSLACSATFTCLESCNTYDSQECADPATQYCLHDACVAKLGNGQSCANPGECTSGFCADGFCCDLPCTGVCRTCAGALSTTAVDGDCSPMRFGNSDTAPIELCTPGGVGCDGSSCACDGSALAVEACLRAVGQACTDDNQCVSRVCECADPECSTLKCAIGLCGTCEYTTTGSDCVAGLGATAPVNDPENCSGTSSCYAGECLLDPGEVCTGAGYCGSGVCECGDPLCDPALRRCATDACAECEYVGAGGNCTGHLDSSVACTDDGDECTADVCSGGACTHPAQSDFEPCSAGHCEGGACLAGVVFTTSGTYTVPSGCSRISVRAYGAGGGAGKAGSGGGGGGGGSIVRRGGTAVAGGGGGGGGGGGYMIAESGSGGGGGYGEATINVTAGQVLSIVVGSGGESSCSDSGGDGGEPDGGEGGGGSVTAGDPGGDSTEGGGGGGGATLAGDAGPGGASEWGGGGGGGSVSAGTPGDGGDSNRGGAGGAGDAGSSIQADCGTSAFGGACLQAHGGGGGGFGDMVELGANGTGAGGGAAAHSGPGAGATRGSCGPGGDGVVVMQCQ